MGAETKEADIVVYSDEKLEETYILIECKKEDLTDQQFNIAVDQAYSYAVAEGAKYVWTTSRIKNQYYELPDKKPKSRIEIPDIPQFGVGKLAPYKYVKGGISQIDAEAVTKIAIDIYLVISGANVRFTVLIATTPATNAPDNHLNVLPHTLYLVGVGAFNL